MELKPEDTRIQSVTVNPSDHTVEFTFQEKYVIDVSLGEMMAVAAASMVIGVMIVTLKVNCEMIKILRTARASTFSKVVNPSVEYGNSGNQSGRLAISLGD